jgi:hypothetical protein
LIWKGVYERMELSGQNVTIVRSRWDVGRDGGVVRNGDVGESAGVSLIKLLGGKKRKTNRLWEKKPSNTE